MTSRLGKLAALLALIAAPLAPAVAQAQGADALAPARQGEVQCYEPNTAQKICAAMASYTFAADGGIDNGSDVLIFPNPLIVMNIHSPVTVRNGAVCGPIRREDIARAQFTINGQPAGDENSQTIRGQMSEQLSALIDVEVCTTLVPDGDAFRAEAVVAGTPRPDLAQHVIWVRPEDGYHVALPPQAGSPTAPTP